MRSGAPPACDPCRKRIESRGWTLDERTECNVINIFRHCAYPRAYAYLSTYFMPNRAMPTEAAAEVESKPTLACSFRLREGPPSDNDGPFPVSWEPSIAPDPYF